MGILLPFQDSLGNKVYNGPYQRMRNEANCLWQQQMANILSKKIEISFKKEL